MDKNILVTGGAGYIGTHTEVELLNRGYNVIAFDNMVNSCEESITARGKNYGQKNQILQCRHARPPPQWKRFFRKTKSTA